MTRLLNALWLALLGACLAMSTATLLARLHEADSIAAARGACETLRPILETLQNLEKD